MNIGFMGNYISVCSKHYILIFSSSPGCRGFYFIFFVNAISATWCAKVFRIFINRGIFIYYRCKNENARFSNVTGSHHRHADPKPLVHGNTNVKRWLQMLVAMKPSQSSKFLCSICSGCHLVHHARNSLVWALKIDSNLCSGNNCVLIVYQKNTGILIVWVTPLMINASICIPCWDATT